LNSWNPLWANVHHLVYMWRMSKRLSGFQKLRVLWNGPGWNPTGVQYKFPETKPGEKRYDSCVYSRISMVHATLHYALAVLALKAIAIYSPVMTAAESTVLLSFIVTTTVSIGGIMDRRPWAIRFDIVRVLVHLALAVVLLNRRQWTTESASAIVAAVLTYKVVLTVVFGALLLGLLVGTSTAERQPVTTHMTEAAADKKHE